MMMNTSTRRTSRLAQGQRGATLVEVLVSILLMSVGMVSMAAMQVNAMQYSKTSEMRSLATLLANDLTDRMRANNPDKASLPTGKTIASEYAMTAAYHAPASLPSAATTSCAIADTATAGCDFPKMAAYDVASWKRDLYRQLPQGTAYVSITSTGGKTDNQAEIWVAWTDPSSTNSQDADACPGAFAAPAGVRCMYFRVAL